MPIDWSDNIILAELSDEPELSEELSAIFERLKIPKRPAPGSVRETNLAPASATEHEGDLPSVVLNFSSVSYLNSSHIASLLRLRKRLLECHRSLVLCSMRDETWSMITLTGLDRVFHFAPDQMTALATVQLRDEQRESGLQG